MIPFLRVHATESDAIWNLSIAMSVELPRALLLCPPFANSRYQQIQRRNVASPPIVHGRSVWTDRRTDPAALFIRTVGSIDTRSAAYAKPLDNVLIEEIKTKMAEAGPAHFQFLRFTGEIVNSSFTKMACQRGFENYFLRSS
ncbi:hypothetical protein [Methylomonas methanica]|uniref:hypothetical protein n=1 Tax=Methylomonas methanica TaxID=421 RepID=UPI00059BC08A|nr:hypothetical protein [Methylomonas methanica]